MLNRTILRSIAHVTSYMESGSSITPVIVFVWSPGKVYTRSTSGKLYTDTVLLDIPVRAIIPAD